jgi:hypothetical protein
VRSPEPLSDILKLLDRRNVFCTSAVLHGHLLGRSSSELCFPGDGAACSSRAVSLPATVAGLLCLTISVNHLPRDGERLAQLRATLQTLGADYSTERID